MLWSLPLLVERYAADQFLARHFEHEIRCLEALRRAKRVLRLPQRKALSIIQSVFESVSHSIFTCWRDKREFLSGRAGTCVKVNHTHTNATSHHVMMHKLLGTAFAVVYYQPQILCVASPPHHMHVSGDVLFIHVKKRSDLEVTSCCKFMSLPRQ